MAAEARYCVEYAKTGRSGCKKCKKTIEKGLCRIGKITANPFGDEGDEMKVWYHCECMFETLQRARATTKKIETPADLEGFPSLQDTEKDQIKQLIKELVEKLSKKSSAKPKKKGQAAAATSSTTATPSAASSSSPAKLTLSPAKPKKETKTEKKPPASDVDDTSDLFHQFCELCHSIEKEPSYNAKTKIVANYIKRGGKFTGDVYLLVKLLLPTAGKKRVYNLQSKQIVKILSQVFQCDHDEMLEDLDKGDVAETAKQFFEQGSCRPAKQSTLTLAEVDGFLDKMADLTKEDDQKNEMSKIIRRCTGNDLRYIIRLIKHDLRINAGPKHVLDALDPNAYKAFQVSQDLKDVVERVMSQRDGEGGATGGVPSLKKSLSVRLSVMTAVKPMLAEACRSVAMAMKKCPHGMFAEIKYDGERVQVHKQGDTFQYFSRSLKPVQEHKVSQVKDYLPQACPHGDSMILDSEVLMVDLKTGNPLPFGTLGIHKKSAFKDAVPCLFVFDIIYFNGQSLLESPISERRKLLEQNIKEVKNRIMLSEQKLVKQPEELSDLIMKVIKQGLEGLVLKDTKSIYEPGKRHWLKVKKDYLEGGAMADTADLLVLGAYYGTGNKGGMMSVFLMGLYDASCGKFRTVCKCGNGHDDATIHRLQKELDMVKISKDFSKVPDWLIMNRSQTPDFVVADPKSAPVWEITGAEFSKSTTHTANGISIRFPRVTRIRDDKDWNTATNLDRLTTLFKTSKENVDIPGLTLPQASGKSEDDDDDDDEEEEEEEEMEVEEPSPRKQSPKKPVSSRKRQPADSVAEKSPKKRRQDPSPQTSPVKGIGKPACKYGLKCYQTNAAHRSKFSHPDDTTCAGTTVEQPLLNLFTGSKFIVDSSLDKAKEIKRYLVAYDGQLLEEHEAVNATHIIADDKTAVEVEDCPDSVLFLKAKWVWDCLNKKQLLPTDPYEH